MLQLTLASSGGKLAAILVVNPERLFATVPLLELAPTPKKSDRFACSCGFVYVWALKVKGPDGVQSNLSFVLPRGVLALSSQGGKVGGTGHYIHNTLVSWDAWDGPITAFGGTYKFL